MFDHVAPTVFWPLLGLAWLAVMFVAVWLFSRWVDSGRPLTRDDRRQLRSVQGGKRAMASDR